MIRVGDFLITLQFQKSTQRIPATHLQR